MTSSRHQYRNQLARQMACIPYAKEAHRFHSSRQKFDLGLVAVTRIIENYLI